MRSGRIDGIIAWHPDRLSRNMKEAGEIIDLLDKGILKDLQFATSSFENSPTGKMLLGISFVLSKQYSEHLSESVTRGNRRKTEEGIFFDEMKHGYLITKEGRLYPDGGNFIIIKQAFEKRLEGMSQVDIAKWLNDSGYRVRKKGKEPAPYKWDKDRVSKIFKDPVYAGVLKYGKHVANLSEYYDFETAISVDDFFKINKVKDFSSAKISSAIMANKRETTKADLLRRLVSCGYCHKPFSSGLTPKKLKDRKVYYYNYKCETEDCEFRGKSVRAKHVLEYAYDFLDAHVFNTKSNYEQYVEQAKDNIAVQTKTLTSDIMSLTKLSGEKQREYERAKDFIINNPKLKDHYNLDTIKTELEQLNQRREELISKRGSIKTSVATYAEYLELFSLLSVKLNESHDMALIDQVLRKFFSNFTIKQSGKGKEQRREITHKLKEPWDGFLQNDDFSCGRGERTRTFDLTVPNRAR